MLNNKFLLNNMIKVHTHEFKLTTNIEVIDSVLDNSISTGLNQEHLSIIKNPNEFNEIINIVNNTINSLDKDIINKAEYDALVKYKTYLEVQRDTVNMFYQHFKK